MLTFQPLLLEHIDLLAPYFHLTRSRLCDFSVGTAFLWREYYGTQFALEGGALYFRMRSPETGEPVFLPPIGREDAAAFAPLTEYCRTNAVPLQFAIVPKETLALLQTLFPQAKFDFDRDWCDYLYHSAEIKNLTGKRFAGQRNHINRFLASYPDWAFTPLGEAHIPAVRAFLERFHSGLGQDSPSLREEYNRILELLANYAHYRQKGGVLFVAGEVAGFSIGETVNDTLIIHIEKADRQYQGAYPMLVNQFAKYYAADDIAYINREEDIGDEGLRTSKLSYHPTALLEKYNVLIAE